MYDTLKWIPPAAAIALFYYIARDYPHWKADRITSQQAQPSTDTKKDDTDTSQTAASSTITDDSSPWPQTFSLRWIPYLPFAVVYLLVKAAWTALRFLVLHSLLLAENTGYTLMSWLEEIVQWSMNHGPQFIQTKIVTPIVAMATSIWESPALAKFKATMEKMILPATYNALVTIKTYVVVTFFSLYAWTHRVAEPVTTAVMWFVVHCIIQPARAIWSRLEVLGITFLQTAKIYLSELVKDAVDLFWFFVKTGKWIYERTLQPLGRVICKAFSILLEKLLLIIPWLAKKSYTGILRPMATTVRSGYTILRSHPTLLAGLQALSIKIQECVMLAMQRLEGVNWLLLIEKVLTNVVVTTYQVLSQILTKVSRGLQILFVDLIPNAYSDLMSALEFAKPIVAWVIDKVVKILHPLWHIVSWISWTVFTNMRPTLAWLQQKIVLPSVNFWNSTLYPVLSTVDAVIMNNIKLVSSSLLRVISWISVVAGPIWVGFVQVLTILQSSLESALVKIGILSGGLGERIQKQIQIMAPQVESFKTQVGVMVDEFVLAANNFMINWAKQEKRD